MTGGGESVTVSCGRRVEAVQLTEGFLDNREFWPAWLVEAEQRGTGEGAFRFDGDAGMTLVVRYGIEKPKLGDWLIKLPSADLMSVSAEEFKRDFIVDFVIDDEKAVDVTATLKTAFEVAPPPKKRKRRKK